MSADVTSPIFYDSDKSGTGATSGYLITSDEGAGDLDSYWDGTKWDLNRADILFKLYQTKTIDEFFVKYNEFWDACVVFVSPEGHMIFVTVFTINGFYGTYYDGETYEGYAEVTYNGSYDAETGERTALWGFPDFEVDHIVIGAICQGYQSEEPNEILQIIASAEFATGPGPFWTNHKGVTEL